MDLRAVHRRHSDELKLKFTRDALLKSAPFPETSVIDDDVESALQWQHERSAMQAMQEREMVVSEFEEEARWLRRARIMQLPLAFSCRPGCSFQGIW